MTHKRIAILWTIVIVFISQLFHCAYTNQRDQQHFHGQHKIDSGSSHKNLHGLGQQQQHHHHHHQQVAAAAQQPNYDNYGTEEEHEDLSSAAAEKQPSGGSGESAAPQQQVHRETYEELLSSGSSSNNQELRQPNARERCRELISLTLLSFRDLSPDERASEEIDCANLREQITAATNRQRQQQPQLQLQQPPQRTRQQQMPALRQLLSSRNEPQTEAPFTQQPVDEFPLAPIYNNQRASVNSMQSATGVNKRQPVSQQQQQPLASNRQQLQQSPLISTSATTDNFTSHQTGWQPKNSYVNQMQQLLLQQQIQQHRQRQRQERENQQLLQMFLNQQQQAQTTTTTMVPTTQATTFESLFETTLLPAITTTTSTTTTTPAPMPAQPRIRIGSGKPRRPKTLARSSTTTTTTTTTTTPKPSTLADYADNSEVSTDYYDEYDDQAQPTTTTTTTTARPNRRGGGKSKRRFSTTSTTPKPSTTSTTLSPGYQPRPDGRIIDYMADPNFPRELKGADLTNYPFYISVPEKIDFECKGRHDGYYTNIDLHCQIYHHCAVGNRYDFLCPNYTLFDQTTFTCRFINTVDCTGSAKHFDRNNALYVEKEEKDSSSPGSSTSASSTSTTTTTTTQAPKLNIQLSHRSGSQQQSSATNSSTLPISALDLIKQHQSRSGLTQAGGVGGHDR